MEEAEGSEPTKKMVGLNGGNSKKDQRIEQKSSRMTEWFGTSWINGEYGSVLFLPLFYGPFYLSLICTPTLISCHVCMLSCDFAASNPTVQSRSGMAVYTAMVPTLGMMAQ